MMNVKAKSFLIVFGLEPVHVPFGTEYKQIYKFAHKIVWLGCCFSTTSIMMNVSILTAEAEFKFGAISLRLSVSTYLKPENNNIHQTCQIHSERGKERENEREQERMGGGERGEVGGGMKVQKGETREH